MTQAQNLEIAQQFLARFAEGKEPDFVAALFSEDVVFEIPGDAGALPWIGKQTGRSAVVDFVREMRNRTSPLKFEIQELMASDTRAVVIGEIATKIKTTGKIIHSAIAIVLTVSNNQITRFQLLEDSFAVSQAARV